MSKYKIRNKLIVYGKNPVKELIISGKSVNEVWIMDSNNSRLDDIKKLCVEKGIPFFIKNQKEIDILNYPDHQGIVAFLENDLPSFSSIEEFFDNTNVLEPYIFVLLDSITDPRNFGAIFRTCDHFGITGIISPQERSAKVNSIVFKSSSGAVNYIPHIQVKNLVRAIEYLKKRGFWIFGLDISGDKLLYDCDLKGNIGIVIGSEGEGMRRLVKESCDFLVKIPNLGHIGSLNVSVASGITMYEIIRQRYNV